MHPVPIVAHAPTARLTTAAALVLAAVVGMPATCSAQLGVSPTRFELDLDQGPSTESVRVLNLGPRDTLIEVEVVNFDLDESNHVRRLPPTEQSLDQWIVLNPLRFHIPAGGSQAVRFSVRPRVRPAPGEHRAMLYFTEVTDPEAPPEPGIRTLHRLGIAIYGWAGERRATAEVHGVEVIDGMLRLDVEATGSAHVRPAGSWALYGVADDTEAITNGELPNTPVLPGTRRWLNHPLPPGLPPGDYVLHLAGTVGDAALEQRITFTVAVSDGE